jgi:hypothetical protein
LVEAASEAETVISSLRKIRQDDNVWQELYQDITNLAEKRDEVLSQKQVFGNYKSCLKFIGNVVEQRIVY